MSPSVLSTITAAVALVIALWTIMANFDKRNQDRFDGLQRQIDGLKNHIDGQIDGVNGRTESLKDLLRAEMREMRAEIRLEIKEALGRRVLPH